MADSPVGWLLEKATRSRQLIAGDTAGLGEAALKLIRRPAHEWIDEILFTAHAWDDRIRWRRLVRRCKDGHLEVCLPWARLLVDIADSGISRELALYGIHEPTTTQVIESLLREGMTVIDVGANIGYYPSLEAYKVRGEGRVIAIEPVPRNLELLRANVTRNNLENIQVVGGAVGQRDGFGQIYLSEYSNWHSTMRSRQTGAAAVQVRMYTLDSLTKELELDRVDLVRMDIEGAEVIAIKGMLNTLQTYRPKIAIEMHPPLVGRDEIRGLLDTLSDIGYVVETTIPRGLDYSRPNPSFRRLDWEVLIENLETWFTSIFTPT